MHVFLLISVILLLPQACSLKCNQCVYNHDGKCEESEVLCSANFTRCGIIREITYREKTIVIDSISGSCFKASDCKDGSFQTIFSLGYFTTKCCDTDNCNTNPPPPPSLKFPNGRKCNFYDRDGNSNRTIDCVGDQFYCAKTADLEGCASEDFCFAPPSIMKMKVECVRNRSSADLLLLSTLLSSLLLSLLWK